jgi:hypothetical protein
VKTRVLEAQQYHSKVTAVVMLRLVGLAAVVAPVLLLPMRQQMSLAQAALEPQPALLARQ